MSVCCLSSSSSLATSGDFASHTCSDAGRLRLSDGVNVFVAVVMSFDVVARVMDCALSWWPGLSVWFRKVSVVYDAQVRLLELIVSPQHGFCWGTLSAHPEGVTPPLYAEET